jgi:hypothetical protein
MEVFSPVKRSKDVGAAGQRRAVAGLREVGVRRLLLLEGVGFVEEAPHGNALALQIHLVAILAGAIAPSEKSGSEPISKYERDYT